MAEEKQCTECGGKLPADTPQGLCPQCLMKLGLPTGVEVDKPAVSVDQSDVPTMTTPPAGFMPPEPVELADQFPQLEILELLGHGGMGAVYKARQKQLDRLVALKILPPQISETEAFAERFTREARSLAKLNHPHIVSVHDFGHTDAGLYYFIMEFVDGTDLRRVIQAGELSPSEALAIVPQVCDALQYAHEEGIVHRDIKPENILLNKKGQVRIADFGLAKLLDRPASTYTLTRAGQKMGTPHYMAPEQIEHPNEVDHRADIYSLGVVFYEMLTGELPLGRFAAPSQKVQVDVRLDKVVLRTLEKEPERRYQHASEVKTDVEAISSGGQVALPSKIPSESVEAVRQRLRIPAIGLMISGAANFLFLALVLGLYFGVVWVETPVMPGILVVVMITVTTAVGVILIVGGWQMLRLRSYGLAVACSILALVPLSAGFMLSVPMGIWALFVLNRSDTQQAFAAIKKRELGKARRRSGMLFGIKIEDHLKIVAYIRIGIGSLCLLAALFLFLICTIPGIATGDHTAMAIMAASGAVLSLFPLVSAVWDLAGGIGLLKRRRWARILVLIGAVPELFLFPVGTAIGIYTIWILMQKETMQLFTRAAARYNTSRRSLLAPAIGLVTGAVVIVVVFAIVASFILEHKVRPSSEEIRLVVLPFENLGSDEDEYFADGITDAITARLAGLHGLGVISRQSAMQYKKTEKNARQIARELGVDYLLEGTVQRERKSDAGSRVRIIPQLIRASDDLHVWAETYDDDMSEVLRVQSDLAERVAQALDITLLEPERRALAARPTENIEAYEYYLRGKEYFQRSAIESDLKIAVRMYEKAIELDPKFASAYAQLSRAHVRMYWLGHDKSQERLASAKQAVSKAIQLDPALPEASLALGHYYYHGHSDYDRALEYLTEARKGRPNDSELLAWIGYVQRRQGKFEQAIENITSAFELDPRSNFLAFNIGLTAVLLRNYSEAERYYEQAISLAPDIESLYLAKARLYMLREGSTEKARAVVNDLLENIYATQSPAISNFLVMTDIYDGNYQEALDRLSSKSTDPNSPDLTTILQRAQLYRYMDKKELAQGYYESARDILETEVKEKPQDAEVRAALGVVYASLGRKQDATREGKLALELLPVGKDAIRGPPLVEQLARIYVMVNEYDLALEQLEYLLSIPSELSIPLLQLDPVWGPLRDHPSFKRLLEGGKKSNSAV